MAGIIASTFSNTLNDSPHFALNSSQVNISDTADTAQDATKATIRHSALTQKALLDNNTLDRSALDSDGTSQHNMTYRGSNDQYGAARPTAYDRDGVFNSPPRIHH